MEKIKPKKPQMISMDSMEEVALRESSVWWVDWPGLELIMVGLTSVGLLELIMTEPTSIKTSGGRTGLGRTAGSGFFSDSSSVP
jgi:hypothetical protein